MCAATLTIVKYLIFIQVVDLWYLSAYIANSRCLHITKNHPINSLIGDKKNWRSSNIQEKTSYVQDCSRLHSRPVHQ